VAQLGEYAPPVQAARHPGGTLPARTPEPVALRGVVGNQVHHRIFSGQQAHDAVQFRLAVVDALEQRPLILDRIPRAARVYLAQFDQLVRRDLGRPGQQAAAQGRIRGVQRQGQRRLDGRLRQPFEHAPVADGRKHQILVADAPFDAQERNGFEHVVQVVRRLAHAHEHDLLHRPAAARQHRLRNDLRAVHLTQQACATGHAEHAPHRTPHLRGYADAIARQQHAFHRLPVRERHQQAHRPVFARMLGMHARQHIELGEQTGQGRAHGLRQEILGTPMPVVERTPLRPGAQHAAFVTGSGTEQPETFAEV